MTSTMISEQERVAMERAYARAQKRGVQIMGRGRRKPDGVPIMAVSSASEAGRWHIVTILPTRLVCSCPAGTRGVICQHRAVVRAELVRCWRKVHDIIEEQEEAKLRDALRGLLAQLQEDLPALTPTEPLLEPVAPAAPEVSPDDVRMREFNAFLMQPAPTAPTIGTSSSAREYCPDVARYDGAADVSPKPYVNNRPITIWK